LNHDAVEVSDHPVNKLTNGRNHLFRVFHILKPLYSHFSFEVFGENTWAKFFQVY
jgi:hypothetical protein